MPKPLLLVADDEPTILLLLDEAFSDEGYEVMTASNGIDALALIARNKPQAMILNINMPLMSGIEVVRSIRELSYVIPCIIITAALNGMRQAQEIGADSCVEKPFDIQYLITTVGEVCSAAAD